MKIAVFGGSGGTGREIIRQALGIGVEVKALLRRPESVDFRHEKLEIIKGDATDGDAVSSVIRGTDAVLSALGAGSLGPTTVYSETIMHIINGMKNHNVSRLLCVGAVGMEPGRDPNMPFLGRLVSNLFLKKVFADMYLMQQRLSETDLEWTMMWPPMLTDRKMTGEYRVHVGAAVPKGSKISRADLAHYMVHHIEESPPPQKVAIAY